VANIVSQFHKETPMKKLLLLPLLLIFALAACGGGGGVPIEERIIGEWSGLHTATGGQKVPATWEFLEGGTMVVSVGGITYGADWSVDGDRVNIATELDPDNPTYRDVEFVSDDVMRLTKAESDIEETWTRVEE